MNDPIYRKIICYMDMDWVAMPDIVWYEIKNTVGMKILGKGSDKGSEKDCALEHLDFCVEWANKELKQNLVWAPTHRARLAACRCFDFFGSIVKKFRSCNLLLRLINKSYRKTKYFS